MSFTAFGLSAPLLRAIADQGFGKPTPIQTEAIPAILAGRDVLAAAPTGTGKSAAFILPILQLLTSGPRTRANHIRALVLTPTRELAVQVAEGVDVCGKYLPLKAGVVHGGVKINPQMMRLRPGLDLLVATPGRLLDLGSRNAVKFAQLEILVLDEADRMLDLGFSAELGRLLALLPKRRQNLLFSATFTTEVRKLATALLNNPLQIEVSPGNSTTPGVRQWVIEVDKGRKPALLSHLLQGRAWRQVLVFTRTRNGADQLVQSLAREGLAAAALHGDKSQGERSRLLADFKAGKFPLLVATDLAARGIDIRELPRVINFELPKVAEDYIHRIGRTGRAGAEGEAISLVCADEVELLARIETLLRYTLAREVEEGFIPTRNVPPTSPRQGGPKKAKKPKQPKP